ncbi:EAL and HDOD domain-containing protein [Lederbergia wuyishanensis]|uniref:EAL and modified HD-GYP domain-containing signal transduction protein n=1 Tax=Lederbergia wuyishanensis TaxID=1347903 RepID=A0ABU0D851_9BACI|nr:HDOD domain-containing protein [Lederbergia wuyishanensis]MCJ8009297.1 HDOD domain-containing protein [Lederbergia wuyishanensis]MDQ0344569.1 EAL and modified HD-GYP domain-containing signal transduction protein [Lederbergia wuyishanensis]
MEFFVARQPIFTKSKEIFAYELLYRSSQENIFTDIDGDVATTDVIVNSFINIGIGQLSNGKPCFINFTERLLNIRLPSYFQPNEIVVEILETVEFNQELVDICMELKNQGYKIALDDFVLNKDNPYSYPLLQLADIVKVDFRETSLQMRQIIEHISKRFHFKLLAEKIETKEEFDLAVTSGYEYFQGYFFSKPIILSTRDIPEYFQNYFVIINLLSDDEPDLAQITEIIERDLSLSYKLLKLINSPTYRPANKINSIRQAIVRIGLTELKKWLYILSIRGSTTVRSEWSKEIFFNSLVRAKMCELIADHRGKDKESSSYFLTGMFSLMDVLLGQNMDEILHSMPLQEDICEALKGKSNTMKDTLDLIISIEKGDWEDFNTCCEKLMIEDGIAHSSYYEAFKWATQLMEES